MLAFVCCVIEDTSTWRDSVSFRPDMYTVYIRAGSRQRLFILLMWHYRRFVLWGALGTSGRYNQGFPGNCFPSCLQSRGLWAWHRGAESHPLWMVGNIYLWQWKTETQPQLFTALFTSQQWCSWWWDLRSCGDAVVRLHHNENGFRLTQVMYFAIKADLSQCLTLDSCRISWGGLFLTWLRRDYGTMLEISHRLNGWDEAELEEGIEQIVSLGFFVILLKMYISIMMFIDDFSLEGYWVPTGQRVVVRFPSPAVNMLKYPWPKMFP